MLDAMLRTTGTLQRKTVTKDSSGGISETWADVGAATDVPCDVQAASASIQFHYQQKHMHVSHTAYVATDIGAKETDRFVSNSRTFRVMGYTPPSINYGQWPGKLDLVEEPL